MMKRTLIALLILGACSAKKADEGEAKPAALVTTAAAGLGSIEQTVAAIGVAEIAPGAEFSLAAPVEAVVASVQAPPGAVVAAGQPVVTLKPSPTARLDLQKAEEDARTAQAAYARAVRLRATGLDSDADVEAAGATAQTAEATRASLSARAAALVLRAPTAGVVETVAQAPGDVAAAGALVAKVGSLQALRARLGVEPATAARVRPGTIVRLTPLADGARPTVEATVAGVDPRADPQTRQASVITTAPGSHFSPGEPLSGVIVLGRRDGVLLVPRAALLYDQDQTYVFVAAGGTAHRHDVKVGASDAARAEIVQGLAVGDRVVVQGAASLEDGMAVREGAVREGQAAPAARDAS